MSGEDIITRLARQMESDGDLANAAKLSQLRGKLDSGQFYIAFCGHFSAGKSSLINQLCGHPLLPSSPIPTSANIVSISYGEPEASIYYNDQEDPLPVPLEQLVEACKDGERIRTVDIRYPSSLLTKQTVLLDTPGIDSTDDAHRLSTESALHLADVVFYVMDYNHVQSEMNLTFTKHLQEWGKPLYLIVNQIDKHREEELAFTQFSHSVEEAFANWNIQPEGIFYLSLREPDHPKQQWQELIWTLHELMQMSEGLRQKSARDSIVQLIGNHMRHKAEANQEMKAAWREELAAMDSPDEAIRSYEANQSALEEIVRRGGQWYSEWKKEADSIIDNANLTPAATRDLAQHYLESRKPGFKVGFFNRATQTAKEIESRLQAFRDDLAEKVQAGLSWHLQSFFKKLTQTYKLPDFPDDLWEQLQQPPDSEWLASQVHSGAEFNGEYTLNYSKQLAADIKGKYRRAAQDLLDWVLHAVSVQLNEEAAALKQVIREQEQQLSAYHKLQELEHSERQEHRGMIAQIEQEWSGLDISLPSPADFKREQLTEAELLKFPALFASAKKRAGGVSSAVMSAANDGHAATAAALAVRDTEAGEPDGAGRSRVQGKSASHANSEARQEQAAMEQMRIQRNRMQETARSLREASRRIADIASLRSASRSMLDKAERLETNRFTIALFGAFSAGKSSFANALLGERILPVSPNPTTAAINTILPPTAEFPHGTVLVQMKTEEKIAEEIRYSLEVLGEEWNDLAAALSAIQRLQPGNVLEGAKPHYTFLKAVERGWAEANPVLGQCLTVNLDQFDDYVANEERSCFVEGVKLHHSNPMTEQGIVIVDTPGADSINARHTGVAFNYIKNADAILFVTYYNHAFSQADREFLLQLGRVKDTFELDKMFFVVNAADLAGDADELNAVVAHVEDNLLAQGIRNARIYPLSSQQAVTAKLNNDNVLLRTSGIEKFEREFIRFTFEELTDIAVRSAGAELVRAAAIMQEWINKSAQGKAEREAEVLRLQEAYAALEQLAAEDRGSEWQEDLQKEIDELLYYVKQRVGFRFNELYSLAFNPSSLQSDTGDKAQALRACHYELHRLLSYDASQEVLATTLRVEQWMNRMLDQFINRWRDHYHDKFPEFPHENYDPIVFITPQVEELLDAVEPDTKKLQRMFKNGKYFFEGDGKALLKTELEQQFGIVLDHYVERHQTLLKTTYQRQLTEAVQQKMAKEMESLRDHVQGWTDALQLTVDLEQLKSTRQRLLQLSEQSRD